MSEHGRDDDALEADMSDALLEQRAARLGQMLRLLDPDEIAVRRSAAAIRPVMARHRTARLRTTWLRAAAIVLLAGAGTLTVGPVRAAVSDGLRAAGVALGIVAAPVDPVLETERPDAVRTTFAWTASVFTIELPADGRVTLVTERGTNGAAAVVHGADIAVIITPAGIRLAPGAAPVMIALELPGAVTTVRVDRAGRVTDHAMTSTGMVIRTEPER